MWNSTVGLVNGRHRYLTAETFGFKVNSNGQMLKRRQQWTIEPFPENTGPDGSISSAASVSSQSTGQQNQLQVLSPTHHQMADPNDPCILTFSSGANGCSLTSIRSSSNGSSSSDQDNGGEEHENVAIKSHLNKYLAVDSFGNVTCDSDEKTENARFSITICSMSQGRSKDEHIFWAFKNIERGYYLSTTEDGMICCNAKMPKSRAELWHLHLLPARGASFFALKSLGRKRFARVAINEVASFTGVNQGDLAKTPKVQVQLDATSSWGPEMLFQFRYFEGGRYSLITSDCKYLTNEGYCIDWKETSELSLPPRECLFTLEYHSGFIAFRDSTSHYLAAAGRSSVLSSRSLGVSRDELFIFEGAPIQVSIKATLNNRWVSIKQGVDVSANQTEVTSKFETFQMNYHKQTQNWSIMTQDNNFWTISQNTSTISVCKPGDYEALNRGQFKLVWSDTDATFCLKYIDIKNHERWISARKSGQLHLAAATQEPIKFIMRFKNRKLLNLRPVDGSGFVGLKSGINSKQIEANKTYPDSIIIEYPEQTENTPGLFQTKAINKLENGSNCPPPTGPKPTMDQIDDEKEETINMFNVRLNSTKKFNGRAPIEEYEEIKKPHVYEAIRDSDYDAKDITDCGVDDNNNNEEMYTLPKEDGYSKSELSETNGSVESTAAPSVASIINSFSNAKIKSSFNVLNDKQQQYNQQKSKVGSSVSKLTSAFNNIPAKGSSMQIVDANHDAPHVSDGNGTDASANHNKPCSFSDQIAQNECCYMKLLINNRYLTAGEKDSGVLCDATNKACAQSWFLELRSHNCIAIRASDDHSYLQLGTNGIIFLSRCDPKEASLWEF